MISDGKPGGEWGVAAVPRRPLRATVTVIGGDRPAGAKVMATATAGVIKTIPSPGRAQGYTEKLRQPGNGFNKGLLGTTHKLSLGTPYRTLLSYRVQRVGRPQSPDVGGRNI